MKNSILVFALFSLMAFQAKAQNIAKVEMTPNSFSTTEIISNSTTVEDFELIKFRKVEQQIIDELQQEISYPALAYDYQLEGTVYVSFIFDGKVKEAKVIKSVGGGCDEAALKALAKFPELYEKFGEAILNPIQITIPFRFNL